MRFLYKVYFLTFTVKLLSVGFVPIYYSSQNICTICRMFLLSLLVTLLFCLLYVCVLNICRVGTWRRFWEGESMKQDFNIFNFFKIFLKYVRTTVSLIPVQVINVYDCCLYKHIPSIFHLKKYHDKTRSYPPRQWIDVIRPRMSWVAVQIQWR